MCAVKPYVYSTKKYHMLTVPYVYGMKYTCGTQHIYYAPEILSSCLQRYVSEAKRMDGTLYPQKLYTKCCVVC